MRWGPACFAAVLAVAAATPVAAAADRFVPGDPGFVVAAVGRTSPDAALAKLLADSRAQPASERAALALAGAFISRARELREPRFMGRAEATVEPWARRSGASVDARRLYAQTLQFRHEFSRAQALYDQLIREQPRDADTRLHRASLQLTRGDFPGARADCAWLAAQGGAAASAGFACLAEALAGSGDIARARALLASIDLPMKATPPRVRAYLLSARAGLEERAGHIADAVRLYSEALGLEPADDSVRASLADAQMLAGDDAAAATILATPNPSLALLARQAALATGAARPLLVRRAHDWLDLETARGEVGHAREAALLALAEGDAATALRAARENFSRQREVTDVRLLARAAVAAEDGPAIAEIRGWLDSTGFVDAITEDVLARRGRGKVRP